MKKRYLISIIIIVLVLVLCMGIFIGRYVGHSTSNEKKPMYWIDSMEPTIHYPGPGKSRMNMDLVPVYPDDESDQSSVRVSPTVINNLGVRTEPVKQGTLARKIETVGYVEPNENKISHVHSYTDGWVKVLLVKAVGDPVKKDQVLLQLYSPTLTNAEEEYLIALDSNNQDLITASFKKLQTLHIPDRQIQQLKNTKVANHLIDVESPQDGVVTALNVREGMHVTPDTDMMSLTDLSTIWMIAQVFEGQGNWVKAGETVEARISSYPEKLWKGEVEYVYPQVDPVTRTLKVRFRFKNTDGVLKPNMYSNVSIYSEPKLNVLSVPAEALIRSSDGNHIILSLGDGRFQSRSVVIGMESDNQVEIISGIKAGDVVVTSGQFLIDSETNLKSGLERIDTSSNPEDTQTPIS